MKRPRHRLTVRRLMLAVAIAAAPYARHVRFAARAEAHSSDARHISGMCRPDGRPLERREAPGRKDAHAERHPWRPVAPDPPEPE